MLGGPVLHFLDRVFDNFSRAPGQHAPDHRIVKAGNRFRGGGPDFPRARHAVALCATWSAGGLVVLDAAGEVLPAAGRERELWPLGVLRVADGDGAGGGAHLYAVSAVAGAIGGFPPPDAAQVHVFATSSTSSRTRSGAAPPQ